MFLETEGSPFFVEEVCQHLSEEGKRFDAGGAWKVDAIGVLERLGEQARKVPTAAAVIGRTFPLDLLEAVDLHDDRSDFVDGGEQNHFA